MVLSKNEAAQFQKTVWAHYNACGRALPWRKNRTPYRVFVSEVMLQQTQVPRVEKKFPEFVRAFPSFRALSRASQDKVLTKWQGMGYNRRALSLRRAAKIVSSSYGGRLPRTPEELKVLPGIGPATAASIAAFAYNYPAVFVETNIRSVFLYHFFPGRTDVSDEAIMPLIEATLPRGCPREWYDALMDYGTFLKARFGNLNVRSKHYVRQSPFAGSVRQARGAVVKALTAQAGASERELGRVTGIERARLRRAVHALVKEGIIEKTGQKYTLPRK